MNSKILKIFTVFVLLFTLVGLLCACDKVWGNDKTTDDPGYHVIDGKRLSFTLEFRDTGSNTEVSEGDNFAHSTLDGKLIKSWQIDCYGNTVYESIVKFFEDKDEKSLSGSRNIASICSTN